MANSKDLGCERGNANTEMMKVLELSKILKQLMKLYSIHDINEKVEFLFLS